MIVITQLRRRLFSVAEHPLSIIVICTILLLLIADIIAPGRPWQTNLWSLQYLAGVEDGNTPGDVPAEHPRAVLWQIQSTMRQGRFDEANALVSVLPENNKLAIRANAELSAANGDWVQAVSLWEGVSDYNSLLLAANNALDEERRSEALIALEAAYRVNPTRGAGPLAELLADQAQWEDVAEFLTDAATIYPDAQRRGHWIGDIGSAYTELGREKEGISVLEGLLLGDTRDAAAYSEIGRLIYNISGDFEQALAAFQRSDALDPQRGTGLREAAGILVREGQFEAADEILSSLADRNRRNLSWQLAYANNARNAGNYDTALFRYRQILERFDTTAEIYYELAWLYYLNESSEIAVTNIEQALALDDSKVKYWYRAGQVYAANGDNTEAAQAYQAALQIDSKYRPAQLALEHLSKE